jgi:hypothetical protein
MGDWSTNEMLQATKYKELRDTFGAMSESKPKFWLMLFLMILTGVLAVFFVIT